MKSEVDIVGTTLEIIGAIGMAIGIIMMLA